MTNRFLTLAQSSVAALALCVSSAFAQAPEKFTFALNWFAVGDHAAYWVALEKGYFSQRGLDVTLENSKGSGDYEVASRKLRTFRGVDSPARCLC